MAQIDSNIALGYKPIQIESPVNQMAGMYQLQGAQQANQLRDMQMQAAQREIEQQNALANAYKQSVTPTGELDYETLKRNLAAGGQGAQIPGIVKSQHEAQKMDLEGKKIRGELVDQRLKQSRDFLDQIDPNSPDAAKQYLAWHNANHADPILGPVLQERGADQQTAFATINKAIQTGTLPQLIEQSKLGITKFQESRQPKPQVMDLHNRSVVIDMNPMSPTFKQELSSQIKGTTEHERVMERQGQSHVNIAADRLKRESEAGISLSPDAMATVAQVYNRTGQLPPLGLGKKAAEVKQQIINLATNLAMQGENAPNAEQRADNIVEAKQNTAAQLKAVKDFSTGKQGDSVRAFNTAIHHLGTLSEMATALENGDTRVFNVIGNRFAKETGVPAPTDFEGTKSIIGGEVAKAVAGSSMALKDREEIRDAIAMSNSPAQLQSTIKRFKQLMGGQLSSLKTQYESSTGRKDFESKLTPASKTEVSGGKPAAALSGQDKQALDWANANPSDPRAAKIKQRLGQ